MIRHLLLLRHAEAGPYAQTEAGDRARTLTPRGTLQAEHTGRSLAQLTHNHGVQWSNSQALTLCSPSCRTRQTAEIAFAHSGLPPQNITYPDALYSASAEQLHDIITMVDDPLSTVLLVGHNPMISQLLYNLCGLSAPVQDILATGYPPATLTLLTTHENWYALRPSTVSFVSAHTA